MGLFKRRGSSSPSASQAEVMAAKSNAAALASASSNQLGRIKQRLEHYGHQMREWSNPAYRGPGPTVPWTEWSSQLDLVIRQMVKFRPYSSPLPTPTLDELLPFDSPIMRERQMKTVAYAIERLEEALDAWETIHDYVSVESDAELWSLRRAFEEVALSRISLNYHGTEAMLANSRGLIEMSRYHRMRAADARELLENEGTTMRFEHIRYSSDLAGLFQFSPATWASLGIEP